MTNTRVSDLEILEKRYPILVKQFSIRPNSGGCGFHPGGNGAIRAFEARAAMTFSLSSERRVHRPYGMNGGGPGASGRNLALLKLPDGTGRWVNCGGKGIVQLKCGEQLFVHTPGGGAWGKTPGEHVNDDENMQDGEVQSNGPWDGSGLLELERERKQPQYWRGTGSLHAYAATQNEG